MKIPVKIALLWWVMASPWFTTGLFSQGIVVQSGGSITVTGAATIEISNGSFDNSGTYTKGSETVTMSGTTASQMLGSSNTTMNKLKITNTGGVTTKIPELTTDSLTIFSGSQFTIDTTRAVTVATGIKNYAGASGLYLKSAANVANATLIFNGTAPLATVDMYSKAYWSGTPTVYRWQYFGLPIDEPTGFNVSPTFDGAYVREYNEGGTGSGFTADKRWIQLSTDGTMYNVMGYEVVQSTPKTYQFQGKLFRTNSITVGTPYTIGAQYPGQTIISNPFTAAIDINDITFGANVEQTIYLYNTGSYTDWQAATTGQNSNVIPGQYNACPKATAGTAGIPGQITSMQGFLVKCTASSNITIAYPTMLEINSSIQRAKKNTALSWLRLNITGANQSGDVMWLFNQEGTSASFDNGWDAYKMTGATGTPQLYVSEPEGTFQVYTTSDINETDIAFKGGTGDTNYTLSFTHENMTDIHPNIYLMDTETNTLTDISTSGTQYAFVSTTTTPTTRFKVLTATPSTTDLETLSTKVVFFNSGKQVFVDNKTNKKGTLEIFDMNGKLVASKVYGSNEISKFELNIAAGNYMARLTNNEGTTSYKFLLY